MLINRKPSIKNSNGFTILELLVVVVIIGLLTALVFSTHASLQRNQRNQERQKDIQQIYQQLEAYNVENSVYPTLQQLNDPSWRATNMKNLNPQWLRDPASKSYVLTATPTKNAYSYDVTAADGSACDDKTKPCIHYTLTATLQDSTVKTFVKSSLN